MEVLTPPLHTTLLQGHSQAAHRAYYHRNVLTVEANKTELSFEINGQLLGHVYDTTYKEGYLGVCVGNYTQPADPTVTVAIFHNAQVWRLL